MLKYPSSYRTTNSITSLRYTYKGERRTRRKMPTVEWNRKRDTNHHHLPLHLAHAPIPHAVHSKMNIGMNFRHIPHVPPRGAFRHIACTWQRPCCVATAFGTAAGRSGPDTLLAALVNLPLRAFPGADTASGAPARRGAARGGRPGVAGWARRRAARLFSGCVTRGGRATCAIAGPPRAGWSAFAGACRVISRRAWRSARRTPRRPRRGVSRVHSHVPHSRPQM